MKMTEIKERINNFCRRMDDTVYAYRRIQKCIIPEVVQACCDFDPGVTVEEVVKSIKNEMEQIIDDLKYCKQSVFDETMSLVFTYGYDIDIENFPIEEIENNLQSIIDDLKEKQNKYKPFTVFYNLLNSK